MKATSGPWEWQLFGDCFYLTAQHGQREIIIGALIHPDYKNCAIPAMNNSETKQMQEVDPTHPNARLLASAPDLLQALIEARHTIQALHGEIGWDLYQNSPEMKTINTALKKATYE